MDDADLEVLLSLDGLRWEAAEGYVVEFGVYRTATTLERPHGVTYALVFRPEHGEPFVRFDSAHAASRPGGRFVKGRRRMITGIGTRPIQVDPMHSPRGLSCSMTSGVK